MAKLVKKKKKIMKTLVPQSSKKVNSEVKRILDANMRSISLEQSDIPYITSFIKALIREQGEDTGEAIPSNTDLPEANPEGKSPADFTPERNAYRGHSCWCNPTKLRTDQNLGIQTRRIRKFSKRS